MLHDIAPTRGRSIAETVLGECRPAVWISHRYAGQQDLARVHPVCLAHVLRDVPYAIDGGGPERQRRRRYTVFAPKLRHLLRWAIRIGKRRPTLKDSTLAVYAATAERRLDALVAVPAAHPTGADLPRQIKVWRSQFFIFLTNRDVPPTNTISEREIRPSVVFRKVTGGFRSDWGARVHAGYRSITGTARLRASAALDTVREFLNGQFAIT